MAKKLLCFITFAQLNLIQNSGIGNPSLLPHICFAKQGTFCEQAPQQVCARQESLLPNILN